MDASEAREHLELIERIVAASSRKLEAGGEFFVIWGVAAALFNVLFYLGFAGRLAVPTMWWTYGAILVVAIALSMWRGRAYRRCATRMSLLQREYFNVLWLTLALAFMADVVGFNLFAGWAASGVWSVAEAIVLFYIGLHGNRRAQIGGIVLIVSIALANFMPAYVGLILAAGTLVGYGGFGLADMLARE